MKKKKWLALIGLVAVLIVSLLLWLSFFRGPQTVLQDGTNTNAISYTDKQFLSALKERYPEIYQNIELENDQAYYVIPGLKQSPSIHHSGNQKGKVGIATDMTPQGLVVVENKYLIISAYSKSKAYNSVLWLLNLKNGQFIKTIALDDIDHVGAITFDDEHDRLWIATINKQNRAQVEALNLSSIENYDLQKSKKAISFDDSVNLNGPKLTSYMVYHKGYLYVGYFNQTNNGTLYAYAMSNDGSLVADQTRYASPVQSWPTHAKVQGISFYEDAILLSQSFGNKESKLYVFKNHLSSKNFDLDEGDADEVITLPPYLEQIVGLNDRVYLLFESASQKYRKNTQLLHMDRVIKLNLDQLIQND